MPYDGHPGDAPAPRVRWGRVVRWALASVAGAAAMGVVWHSMSAAAVALVSRFQLSPGWAGLVDGLIAPVVSLLLGGAIARVAVGTRLAPGWSGVSAAWLLAACFPLVWLVPIRVPHVTAPVFRPPPAGAPGFSIHVPAWLLIATVFALFAYWGDKLAWRIVYARRVE